MRNSKNTQASDYPASDCGVWNALGKRVAQPRPNKRYVKGPRPDIECDNGEPVHRYAEVNATCKFRPAERLLKRLDAKISSRSDNCCLRIWGMVTN